MPMARNAVFDPRAQRHEPAPWNAELDPREQKFVELYVETSNATRSALPAGYGRNYQNAGVYATTLLKKPRIKNAVDKRNAEIMARFDFTPERIIREIAKIAEVNSADFITMVESADGTETPVIDFSRADRAHLAAVSSVENGVKGTKYKTHDKLKALDMLARMSKLYPADRQELTGADGGPIQTANLVVHKVNLEDLEPEQRDQLRQVLLALKAKHEAQHEGESSSENEDGP
jgi:phage terminase small subunit